MPSFADMMREAAAKREKEKDELRGTGITKRVAERADKGARKIAELTETTRLDTDTRGQTSLLPPAYEPPRDEHGNLIENVPPQPPVFSLRDHVLPDTLIDEATLTQDSDQDRAVAGIMHEKFSVLIGAAGTGKTTTIKRVLAGLSSTVPLIDFNWDKEHETDEDINPAMCICAFMGRAVQETKRALPQKYHSMCDTVHGTLGYRPVEEEYEDEEGNLATRRVFRPTYTADNQLPYRICVIDEGGTLNIHLFNELRAALPDDCRIVIVGDINQLPPVHGHAILGFAMLKWPTFELKTVHRVQGENSSIIDNAHRILNGQLPLPDKRVTFVQENLPGGSLETLRLVTGIIQKLHRQQRFDPMGDAFIVPQNKSAIGQVEFNQGLVNYFNQTRYEHSVPLNPRIMIRAGFTTLAFAVGDKVMQLENERSLGLTNGMMGVITEISINQKFKGEITHHTMADFDGDFELTDDFDDHVHEALQETDDEADNRERQASHVVKIKYRNVDDEVEFSTSGALNKIAHAYAFTCHKAQGGEFPNVVILCHSANFRMLTREWLYTAWTRAQQRVVLLCNKRGLLQAINTQRIKGRTTDEKARSFIACTEDPDRTQPDLNEPVKVIPTTFAGTSDATH